MPQDGWKDWWQLSEDFARVLTRKAYREDGSREDLHFSDIAIWKVSAEYPWGIYFKYSHFEREHWKYIEVRKTPRTPLMRPEDIQCCNCEISGKKIKKAKWQDLQKLTRYLKEENRVLKEKMKLSRIDSRTRG
jgi:hypothetical protein